MQYFGGKTKVSKFIAPIINSNIKKCQTFISPFIGGGIIESMIVADKKICCDANSYLIEMYNKLKEGWTPPTDLSKEEYIHIKNNKDEKPYLTGFVGFACSFAGKWFGGYAFDKFQGKNYCNLSHNSLLRKWNNGLKDCEFICTSYKELKPSNSVIYCDPPYANTTSYGAIGKFDSEEFWNIMREWSKTNLVFISEYEAPEDFIPIWTKETKTQIRNSEDNNIVRLEKLFIHKDNKISKITSQE